MWKVYRQMDEGWQAIRKAHLSFQLRWAKMETDKHAHVNLRIKWAKKKSLMYLHLLYSRNVDTIYTNYMYLFRIGLWFLPPGLRSFSEQGPWSLLSLPIYNTYSDRCNKSMKFSQNFDDFNKSKGLWRMSPKSKWWPCKRLEFAWGPIMKREHLGLLVAIWTTNILIILTKA